MRRDPRLAAARAWRCSRGSPRRRPSPCATRRPSTRPSVERAPSATISCAAPDLRAGVQHHRRDATRRIMLHINGFDAQQHLGAVVDGHHPDPVVEFGARHRAAGRTGTTGPATRSRRRRRSPTSAARGARSGRPATPPRPSRCSSATARGVSPSPHALSRGNCAESMTSTSRPARHAHAAAAEPRPARRPRRRPRSALA